MGVHGIFFFKNILPLFLGFDKFPAEASQGSHIRYRP